MEQGGLFALVIVVALVALAWSLYAKHQRRQEWAATAAGLGLQHALGDPFATLDLDFRLFSRGEGRGIEHVSWGELHGVAVRTFDYCFYTTSTDSNGDTSRQYQRFTCALTPVPIRCPHTSIERETLLTRLADVVGFRDQEFESEEFNRRFQVKSRDPRFASYLIDARMMEWLLATGADHGFELLDEWALCVSKRIRPAEVRSLLDRLLGFRAQIPRVVLDVYGSGAR